MKYLEVTISLDRCTIEPALAALDMIGIDDAEVRNGIREDGSVYALYSFARKMGQAASAGLTGVLLSAIGYSQETAFDPDVVNALFDISTLLPALGFGLLAAILWFWYPLHKRKVEENVAILKKKHSADG